MDDKEIIALFYERSEQAITEMTVKYSALIQRISQNILNDPMDVEESMNDTVLSVWNSIPPAMPISLKAYVCAIARNTALVRYHANTAVKRNSSYDAALDEIEEYVPSLSGVETEVEAKELSGYINMFLGTLKYDDRYIFIHRYYFSDTVGKIASEMKISAHRVSVKLSRIRAGLQKYLKKEGLL